MQFEKMSTALLVSDVGVSARFYAQHLAFDVVFDIGWFASLRHASGATLDLWQRTHESVPSSLRKSVGGTVLAFVVADARAEERRFVSAGVPLAKALTDNAWGQRNFMVEDPDGTIVDVVQPIAPDPEFLRAHGLG
jgi:catechol 2,3-dioxygenase-like lactoylglutathione lyase family enzyme